MASVGESAARGLESGFRLGLDSDKFAEQKRQSQLAEQRQADLDRAAADQRARSNTRQDKADAENDDDRALAGVNSEISDHALTGAGLAAQYGGVDKIPASAGNDYAARARDLGMRRSSLLAKRYAPQVQKEQQWAQDTASRIQTGQLNMDDLSPADTVRFLQASLRRPVTDLLAPPNGKSVVGQAVADASAGLETGNKGLIVQGANTLLAPDIAVGTGHVAPDGSRIVSKSLYSLVPAPSRGGMQPSGGNPIQGLASALTAASQPGAAAPTAPQGVQGAMDAAGAAAPGAPAAPPPQPDPNAAAPAAPQPDPNAAPAAAGPGPAAAPAPAAPPLQPGDDPDRVMPVLQVTAEHPDGTQVTYHAPVTSDRSTGGEVSPGFSIQSAIDHMGRMGTLEAWANTPAARAKIEDGLKELGGDANSFISAYYAMHGDPSKLLPPGAKDPTSLKIAAIQKFAKEQGVDFETARDMINGSKGVQVKLDAIDDLDVPDSQKDALKRDVLLGAGGKTTGLVKKPGAGGGGGTGLGGGAAGSTALAGAPAPDPKSDAAVDFWARAVIAGDKDWQVGLGRSKTGSELIEKVKRRVPQLAADMGLGPSDIGTSRAQGAALDATLKDLTKRSAAIDLFSSKVDADMKTFDTLLDKAGSDSPLLINKPINALRRQFSDSDLAQLDLASKQVAAEYERLIQGGTLSVAQLHAGASEDAKKMLNGDMPPQQARAIMATMRQEMANAKATSHAALANISDQRRNIAGGIGLGTGKPATPATGTGLGGGAAPAAVAPPGVQTATNPKTGERLMLQNGQWVPLK